MVNLEETIVVPGDMAGVDRVRAFLKKIAGRLGWPEEYAFHLELAAAEACTNIVRYAYPDRKGEIRLSCRVDGGRVRLEVRDDGRPFDPRDVASPDLDRHIRDGVKGGFGVFLMRSLVDEVDYSREGGQNILTLWKKLPPA